MSRIDEIRKRLEAATPGPWEVELSFKRGQYEHKNHNWAKVIGPNRWFGEPSVEYLIDREYMHREDAELIAHAPADIALLLELVEKYDALFSEIETIVAPNKRGNYSRDACSKVLGVLFDKYCPLTELK